ncbi:alkaline phosphatase [Flavobacterium reichenbachii]|uniref:Alkaline phosphatase n=1 Tax=Flavobacterium reichenbachii TaxID=362418 RepID=A0A085ZIA4_9FLAO|nr:alkaline phosphatase [Flavobacterium reichenbachii]KFF04168.1 alkaline phosphatase [Flavobacterium reichenbachii]OXB13929.1 alkaline phosphatase [Flavobacterium reichenbachii]
MKKTILLFCLHLGLLAQAQEYSSANIHSHNDYASPLPFYEAYANETGVIEADVFLVKNDLLVSHTSEEIKPENTLKNLYLEPLLLKFKALGGKAYKSGKPLILMIDIKSDAETTLKAIADQLKMYPDLISNKNLKVVISGNRPSPSKWNEYPAFIFFDGRLNENYNAQELSRVEMISEDLKEITVWNGKGVLTQGDSEKIQSIIKKVHDQNKKIRFWSTQDNVNTWMTLMNLHVDYIATDNTSALTQFIKNIKSTFYQNTEFHETYVPKNGSVFPKNKKPKNVILLIGDGMGLAQIYAGYTANKGKLNMFNIPTQGFSITKASDSYITDSAAGATAMATGHKTNNRFISVDEKGKPLELITQQLAKKNYKTAIISAGNITDATPAAFYAHQPERSYNEAIAADFLNNPSDILIGGGANEFKSRKDGKNLAALLQTKGYTFSDKFSSLDTISNSRFIVLDNASVVSRKDGRGDFLAKSLLKATTVFSKSKNPFFIMAEGAQIDYGGHSNNVEYVVRELLDFDRLVGQAMEFVDKNPDTILIVTADHETGGLSLIDGSIEKGYVHGSFSTNDHTSITVPVFAYGPGAQEFMGVYQNTEIYNKIMQLLAVK